MNKKAIGIFDSGVGGLTVFEEIRKELPNENVIYLGDTKNFPYGNVIMDDKRKIIFYPKEPEFIPSDKVFCFDYDSAADALANFVD